MKQTINMIDKFPYGFSGRPVYAKNCEYNVIVSYLNTTAFHDITHKRSRFDQPDTQTLPNKHRDTTSSILPVL